MVVTEIFDDDQEQAAHVKSLTEKPARPRRPRKKAEPAVDDATAASSEAGKSKPSRPSRKRKAQTPQEPQAADAGQTPALTPPVVDDLDASPAPASRPRKTPARRPRARKAAAAHAEAPADLSTAAPAEAAAAQPVTGDGGTAGVPAPEADRPPVLDSLIAPAVPAETVHQDDAPAVQETAPARPSRASRSRSRRTPAPAPGNAEAAHQAGPADDTPAPDESAIRPPVIEELLAPAAPAPAAPDAPAEESRPEAPKVADIRPVDGDAPAEGSRSETPAAEQAAPQDSAEAAPGLEQEEEASPRRKRTHRGGRNRRKTDAPQAALPASDERLALPASDEPLALPPTADLLIEPALVDPAVPSAAPESEAMPAEAAAQPASKPRSRSARRRAAAARRKAEAAARAQEAAAEAAAETPGTLPAENADADAAENENAVRGTKPAAERKMLVSVLPGELVEVVILEDNLVAEYYVEMVHQAKIRGNIYKGIVSNIDPNLQAAFVNFGGAKNGFLQIDEVHPEYWLTHHDPEKGGKYPPIQKVMKAGQEVLVQVVKEPNGSKGAFLTTWVSLAGRFLVLTPGQEQIGISRKVEDGEERNRLRELIKGLNPGEGLGAIVRTVSAGTSKTTLQKDLSYLKRVWKDIHKRAGTEKAPCLIYEEPGLASRAVRDYLSDDVTEVWVDDPATAESMRAMTSMLFPRRGDFVRLYDNPAKSMWEYFNVRKQLEQVHAREVTLPSGGRLVFDQTEALMAIDINSGKSGGKNNFEATALRTNLEAAESIARQLRLRDVGGQIVIDFIEMRDQSRCREVERTLHAAMKSDRARHDIGHMSSFGLLQIVRQRIGSSAISISQEPCPHCRGTGLRRNMEWQALQLLRELRSQMRLAARNGQSEYIYPLGAELAVYVLNHKRERLAALEKEFHLRLEIRIAPGEV